MPIRKTVRQGETRAGGHQILLRRSTSGGRGGADNEGTARVQDGGELLEDPCKAVFREEGRDVS